jgi:predicted NBD/HSP70 family sugar kinase
MVNTWDPRPFLGDKNGHRIIEEIVRRTRAVVAGSSEKVDYVVLTLPGTVSADSKIEASSRLGITEEVDVAALCDKLNAPRTYLFHDAECQGIGEVIGDKGLANGEMPQGTFAFILVDEGVGASLFIDGRPYRGAGAAGHIGRLVLEPNGAFNSTFACRGTLEVYAARPWVSQNVVNEYLSERGKLGAPSPTSSTFRAAVAAAAEGDNARNLSFSQLDYDGCPPGCCPIP